MPAVLHEIIFSVSPPLYAKVKTSDRKHDSLAESEPMRPEERFNLLTIVLCRTVTKTHQIHLLKKNLKVRQKKYSITPLNTVYLTVVVTFQTILHRKNFYFYFLNDVL